MWEDGGYASEGLAHLTKDGSTIYIHYMLDCFLYTTERQALFSLVEHYIPNFSKLNKKAKYDLLTTGLKNEDPDFNH